MRLIAEEARTGRADPIARWLPFAMMGAVAIVDLMAGPEFGYLPLLALGPAFATLHYGARHTVLIGLIAFTLCVVLAAYDNVLGQRQDNLTLASIIGVTSASVLASRRRQERERELATVRTVAEAAQRVLLRPVPRSAGPLRIAVNYTSAAAEARIGGDLYEVVITPFGVRILIGDVQGKGLEAVETAAGVLGAFREAAYDEADLPGVVKRLEKSLSRMLSGERFVTAALAQFGDAHVRLVNCGHPPPLIIGRTGDVRVAEPEDPSPPLGMTDLIDAPPRPYLLPFSPGDQMLLYTDGVIEARNGAGQFYPLIDRAVLLRAAGAEEALSDLQADLIRHTGGPIADDAAMLLVRHR
ncbi:PP2C family protein-serine/threonine phosphatase [Actinoallomurus sp. NPDC052274]|uniref:PP2C family protein-serine/threonine phosphatase n=1 Tax=Actinoallomurus sp. NPDC052274 TaxID=3155420 RepID=UPI0034354B5E